MKQSRVGWAGLGMCGLVAVWAAGSWAGCAAAEGLGSTQVTPNDTSGDETTSTGTGGPTCPGATLCGEACTNLTFDPANCGVCGTVCAAGELCSAGMCAATCAP